MDSKGLTCLIPSLGGGGAERQMSILIKMMNEDDISPNVITYFNKLDDYDSTIEMFRHKIISNRKWVRNIQILLQLIKIRPKILLAYTGDANLMASIYKMINPFCRVIVSDRTIMDGNLTTRSKLLLWLYRFVDCIVPNTITQAKILYNHNQKLKGKIKVISNYTELKTTSEIPECFKHSGPVRIIIPARIHPVKNVFNFLQALLIVQNHLGTSELECIWYGGGQNSPYFQKCKEFIRENDLRIISFNEFSKDIDKEIRKSDIVCIPSVKEGFSNALAEGLCNGKALLASNVSDNVRMCRDDFNGFTFDPNNVEDIARAILRIIKDSRVRDEFKRNSLSLAKEMFNKETFYQSYKEILFGHGDSIRI